MCSVQFSSPEHMCFFGNFPFEDLFWPARWGSFLLDVSGVLDTISKPNVDSNAHPHPNPQPTRNPTPNLTPTP